MPSFQGRTRIELQPNDRDIPYRFTFTVCSGENTNDGHLPYGDGISCVAVTGWTSAGVEDTELVGTNTESGNVVTVPLSYPVTNGLGKYSLRFVILTDLGSTVECDFDRVFAMQKGTG